jgi:TolA-binding protein
MSSQRLSPRAWRDVALAAALAVLAPATRPAAAQQPDSAPVPAAAVAAAAGDSVVRAVTPAEDSLYQLAQRLVAEGQGAAGRAIVDSLIAAAPAGTPRYAEALFWRASLAATANEAERDYGRLAVEFPLSPRSEDALLRLAQLQIARGDRIQAIRHLNRLLLEHPASTRRARTAYWLAYAQFEERNVPRACAALASARASTQPTDVELRNQIDYYAQRCEGVDTSVVLARRPAAGESRTAPPGPRGTVQRTEAGVTTPPPAPTSGRYTIQVAAFNTRAAAAQLRDRLAARGYAARVVGTAEPYRVRIGRYPTREAAQAAARDLEAKKVVSGAFVTEAEAR